MVVRKIIIDDSSRKFKPMKYRSKKIVEVKEEIIENLE